MNANGKKFKEEWSFFISPITQKLTYNKKCLRCVNNCKQSYRAEIFRCPYFHKKEDALC